MLKQIVNVKINVKNKVIQIPSFSAFGSLWLCLKNILENSNNEKHRHNDNDSSNFNAIK